VYLYDINALLQPLSRPRQLLPYAIVTYTVDGVHQDVDDIEPVVADVPSQLQQIIQRINAKADASVTLTSQRMALENLSRSMSVPSPAVPASPVVSESTPKTTGAAATASESLPESPEANLQRVIAQINARLESQERRKQLAMQNVAAMCAAASALPSTTQPADLNAGRVLPRSIGDPLSAGLNPRPDPGPLAVAPATAASGAALAGFGGDLPSLAAQPKLTNIAAPGSGFVTLAATGRSPPFAVTPELVGGTSALAGIQYQSPSPIVSAPPYLRTLPNIVDTGGIAAVDPSSMVASQPVKYIPYQSPSRDISMVGAAPSAGGLYPLQSVMPAEAVGAGYTLVNSGAAVKRPLNDVMLYMVDKRPRYY